ncbi:hypothetical protein [Nocardioides sp. J54]|uniref:hypothetical protein n=1 Tax=Nocardioides sp. J54 TaxID=935866 RepID=UPI00048FDA87|nr:hypothetical protein [Nocardioides sp. J54]
MTDDDIGTGVDTLADTVAETHDVLSKRLAEAGACRPTRDRPRDRVRATDPFLASTSRHVAAVNAVLGPAARRHLPDGRQRAHELVHQSRLLEAALFQTKSKLYGSTFAVRRPWTSVWDEVTAEFDAWWRLERALVDDIAAAAPADERERLAERLFHAEQHVPTRPHPYLPHQGVPGRVARQVAMRVDRFWDTAEGRMVPEPVHPHRSREGRLTQYLLADPHVDPPAPDEG